MSNKNPVVHFEMAYDNADRLQKFYSEAFGWQMMNTGAEMGNYVLAGTTETDENQMVKTPGHINGVFYPRMPETAGSPTNVVIAVEDIERAMKNVTASGGKVLGEPQPIPGIGMFVNFLDSEGNRVCMLQPSGM